MHANNYSSALYGYGSSEGIDYIKCPQSANSHKSQLRKMFQARVPPPGIAFTTKIISTVASIIGGLCGRLVYVIGFNRACNEENRGGWQRSSSSTGKKHRISHRRDIFGVVIRETIYSCNFQAVKHERRLNIWYQTRDTPNKYRNPLRYIPHIRNTDHSPECSVCIHLHVRKPLSRRRFSRDGNTSSRYSVD